MGAQSGENVVVGCKLPHGLHLDIYSSGGQFDASKRVSLNGMNKKQEGDECGLTLVDKSFIEAWMKQHKAHPAVVNGLIFVRQSVMDAKAEGKDRKKQKTGFEGIDPDKPGETVPGVKKSDETQPDPQ